MPKPHIEILVRGVYVTGGRLLVCRNAGRDICYLPGGHVEFGEPAREALVREIHEELGLPAQVGTFLGGVEHGFVQDGTPHREINLVFAMTIEALVPDRPVTAAESHLRFAWLPLEALTESTLEPAILRDSLPAMWNGDTPRWLSGGSLAAEPGRDHAGVRRQAS